MATGGTAVSESTAKAAQLRFVNVGCNVMQGGVCVATAVSKTLAKRIAHALNIVKPTKEGV
jgi:hypothetical protein